MYVNEIKSTPGFSFVALFVGLVTFVVSAYFLYAPIHSWKISSIGNIESVYAVFANLLTTLVSFIPAVILYGLFNFIADMRNDRITVSKLEDYAHHSYGLKLKVDRSSLDYSKQRFAKAADLDTGSVYEFYCHATGFIDLYQGESAVEQVAR